MQREPALFGVGPDFFQGIDGGATAAGQVGGVLNFDEPGGGAKGSARVDVWLNVFPGQDAALGLDSTARTRQPEKTAVVAISQSRMWARDSAMTS